MSDLTELANIKIEVLKGLEDMFPETVVDAFEKDYLCYFMLFNDNTTSPVIDFTKKMPIDINTYQTMIQKSAGEWYHAYQSNYSN